MEAEPKGTGFWKTLPGMMTATAAMMTAVTGMFVAFHQLGFFKKDTPPSHADGAVESSRSSAPASDAPSVPGSTVTGAAARYASATPRESELRVGPMVYRILGTRLESYSGSTFSLSFAMRFTNVELPQGMLVSPALFRLFVDDVPLAPREFFSAVVEFQSAQEDDVVFAVPATAKNVVLQIGEIDKDPRRVPIDLKLAP